MAWTDEAREVGLTVYSVEGYNTLAQMYDGARVRSCDWTQEASMLGLSRRLGDATLRITNDFSEGTDDRAGWRGPAMSAVQAEDPQALLGKTICIGVSEGTTEVRSDDYYRIDSVDASDSEATIHATAIDSCLDRTLDEVGAVTSLTASTRPITWAMNTMAAAGWDRNSIVYTGSNATLGAACQLDPQMTVSDAVKGLLAASGRGYIVNGKVIYIQDMSSTGGISYTAPYDWPTPVDSERYGLMVVSDPADGSSREVVLDSTVDGTLEVTVPYSAGMDLTTLVTWAQRRYVGTQYRVSTPGSGAHFAPNSSAMAHAARWRSGSVTRAQIMRVLRVEHRYDGGYSEAYTGPLDNVVSIVT